MLILNQKKLNSVPLINVNTACYSSRLKRWHSKYCILHSWKTRNIHNTSHPFSGGLNILKVEGKYVFLIFTSWKGSPLKFGSVICLRELKESGRLTWHVNMFLMFSISQGKMRRSVAFGWTVHSVWDGEWEGTARWRWLALSVEFGWSSHFSLIAIQTWTYSHVHGVNKCSVRTAIGHQTQAPFTCPAGRAIFPTDRK